MRDMVLGSRDYEDRSKAIPPDPGAQIAFEETDSGYNWECLIPWSMLGNFDPSGDVPLGVNYEISDYDKPGASCKTQF